MSEEMTDKIKALLSNPEAMNMFSSLLSPTGENSANDASDAVEESKSEDDFAVNMKNVLAGLNKGNDKRLNLLYALKPYMRESRSSNIDKAIKMLKISQLSSLFKDL